MRKSITMIGAGVLASLMLLGTVQAAAPCCARTAAAAVGPAGCPEGPCMMMGTQAYTFRLFTLFEAIDKAQALGLHAMEGFPGQTFSKDHPDVKFDHNLPLPLIAKLKNKLDDAQVRLLGYGVVGLPNDEAEARKVFDFAKVLGVTTITTEPDEAALELIDRLANEYQINIAIHNHPAPSHYWSPDVVLKAIEGRSKRIGACADTGHWVRSGLDPLECLKKLEGRILWSHFKDLKEKKKDSHDVPWGTGVSNAKALLVEMHRQGFKGCIIVEYEHNWENSMPEIAQCAAFFQKVMSEICPAKKAAE